MAGKVPAGAFPPFTASVCAILSLCVAVAGMAAVGSGAAIAQGPPRKVPVDVAKPLERMVREWDEYTGRFQAVQRVELRARVSGYLQSIHFNDGELVKKGDLLFKIDPRPFAAQLAAAEARLESAKAELKLADAEVARGEELKRKRVVADAEVFNRRAQKDVRAANVLVAEAEVESARLNLEFTEIRAPVDGLISSRKVDVGNLVAGGTGTTTTLLTTINTLDPIHFVFDVSEQAYLKYARLSEQGKRPSSRSTANPVYIRIADEEGWPHKGTMDFVDNEIGQETGTVRGRAIIGNSSRVLQPGLFGRIRIIGSGEYQAVLIPDKAILSDQASKIVMLVDENGKVEARKIQIGPIVDGLRVVKDGLSVDDRIVVAGMQKIQEGQEVEATEVTFEAKPDGLDAMPPVEEDRKAERGASGAAEVGSQ